MYARTWLTVVIGIALLGGCGSDPPKPRLPYATDSTNVIGGDGNFYNPDGGAVSPIGNSGTCDAH
ncbi:MAG TPA: hypothetical protein VHM19_02550, partial [Polyangiales bacterium]|nr:hypothetical protein [Polyangiales bacterium]